MIALLHHYRAVTTSNTLFETCHACSGWILAVWDTRKGWGFNVSCVIIIWVYSMLQSHPTSPSMLFRKTHIKNSIKHYVQRRAVSSALRRVVWTWENHSKEALHIVPCWCQELLEIWMRREYRRIQMNWRSFFCVGTLSHQVSLDFVLSQIETFFKQLWDSSHWVAWHH